MTKSSISDIWKSMDRVVRDRTAMYIAHMDVSWVGYSEHIIRICHMEKAWYNVDDELRIV